MYSEKTKVFLIVSSEQVAVWNRQKARSYDYNPALEWWEEEPKNCKTCYGFVSHYATLDQHKKCFCKINNDWQEYKRYERLYSK
jgi:hypothetical protein